MQIKYFISSIFLFKFQVLDFEPNNITAKEFYPLIEEKMRSELIYDLVDLSSDSDDDSEDSYSAAVETQSDDEKCSIDSNKSKSSNSSHSPLFASNSSICDSISSNANPVNSSPQTAQPFGESENTSYSYSNSLLEDPSSDDIDDEYYFLPDEEEDVNLLPNFETLRLSDLNNGELNNPKWKIEINFVFFYRFTGNYQPTFFSDSESPSEPLTLKSRTELKMD